MDESKGLLPDERLAALAADEGTGAREVEAELERYPDDPRLHFLLGSLLASGQRYDEAREAMREAVQIAPDYRIARFQLGLLELSSGRPEAAEACWDALAGEDDSLALFARGLRHLARDEFEPALSLLREGIARNRDHPAVNGNIQLIIDETAAQAGPCDDDTPLSATQMLLQQFAAKPTRH
ncbi:tetratricopeptide repeat protein [Allosphingosinicella sp.]|jgi:tetratricopeptide (TPR) repeat protein|uniref:tetratricopeptide repeat protein n=1 Tax=Allosphingosinicella sp. TaxID=2823234 RepID=UPI002EE18DD4